jgi:hypothetical protein
MKSVLVSFLACSSVLVCCLLLPRDKAPARSSWYVEIVRGGEHVSTYLTRGELYYGETFTEFTTVEGVRIRTTAPVITKERAP